MLRIVSEWESAKGGENQLRVQTKALVHGQPLFQMGCSV